VKKTKQFFLFLRDLLGWLVAPGLISVYKWNDTKELWCRHFGCKSRIHQFNNVHVFDGKMMYKHGFASIEICIRCANPIRNPTAQTMPIGRPD